MKRPGYGYSGSGYRPPLPSGLGGVGDRLSLGRDRVGPSHLGAAYRHREEPMAGPVGGCARLQIKVPYGVTQAFLNNLCDMVPGLEYCDLNPSTGMAFVRYNSPENAEFAMTKLNGFQGPNGGRLIVTFGEGTSELPGRDPYMSGPPEFREHFEPPMYDVPDPRDYYSHPMHHGPRPYMDMPGPRPYYPRGPHRPDFPPRNDRWSPYRDPNILAKYVDLKTPNTSAKPVIKKAKKLSIDPAQYLALKREILNKAASKLRDEQHFRTRIREEKKDLILEYKKPGWDTWLRFVTEYEKRRNNLQRLSFTLRRSHGRKTRFCEIGDKLILQCKIEDGSWKTCEKAGDIIPGAVDEEHEEGNEANDEKLKPDAENDSTMQEDAKDGEEVVMQEEVEAVAVGEFVGQEGEPQEGETQESETQEGETPAGETVVDG